MRICIITVYNSLNCGSFLQAYALQRVLETQGHEVVFLRTGVKKPGQYMAGTIAAASLTGQFARAAFNLRKWRGYAKANRIFRQIPFQAGALESCDLFVFGSDEIWNAGRQSFARHPVLWGQGIDLAPKIAYAPSINRTTLEQLRALGYPAACLEKFSRIMVRDQYTKEILSRLTSREITTVLDPTLLLEPEDYPEAAPRLPDEDYLLLYAYEGTKKTKSQIDHIRRYAQRNNLKIVSANDWFGWCDYNIPVTPLEFPALVKKARVVVTETFHGTLFSILYSKPFAVYAGDNVKVTELLDLFGLQSRRAEPESELVNLMDERIAYGEVHQLIHSLREQSMSRLLEAIDAVGA